jgi:hypothetical protein
MKVVVCAGKLNPVNSLFMVQVLFRVSNNDIALAYRLASPKQTHCTIKRELTGFNFPAHTTTFITPQAPSGEGWMKTKPSYEEEYTNEEPIGLHQNID